MHDPNWWLMALSFVLGLVLTFALMVRRVKREVPVSTSTADTDDEKS
jgi:flagellar biogenesis protein FliO